MKEEHSVLSSLGFTSLATVIFAFLILSLALLHLGTAEIFANEHGTCTEQLCE